GGCWVRLSDLTGAPGEPVEPEPTTVIEYVFVSAPAPAGVPARAADAPREALPPYPTMRPETAATVQAIWNAHPAPASHLPPGVDPLAGCVDGCRVFVTPAPEGRTP
ncbi:MAG: hypothetical protein RML84_11370, partial [Anaerolineae bacterium]|nr:hypothetical protein [Anaerolineae bacterium]